MKPKWVYLFKTGLLTVLVGACMTMAPLSRLARIGLQPAAAAEKYGPKPPGATDHERLPLGGHPLAVVIDPTGRVAYNGFHIEADEAKALIDRLIGDLD